MRFSTVFALSSLVLVQAGVIVPRQEHEARSLNCDKHCLTKITVDYVDGLQLRNLTNIALDKNVRYTDGGVDQAPGTGVIWTMAGGVRLPWRQAIYDVKTGQVFFNAIVTNFTDSGTNYGTLANSTSYDWTVRLKVQNKLITEIEEIHYLHPNNGTGINAFDVEAHHGPDRTWDDIIPESERSTSSELTKIAYSYWVAVNGTYPAVGRGAVFGPECQRLEFFAYTTNGQYVAGGCGTGIPRWTLSNPRIYITDPTRGVVAGFFNLERPGIHIVISEWFKIKNGYISQIEAFFDRQGQNVSGWPTFHNYTTLVY